VLEGLRGEDSIAGLCRCGVGAHCSSPTLLSRAAKRASVRKSA
jgi:hypothetical protein